MGVSRNRLNIWQTPASCVFSDPQVGDGLLRRSQYSIEDLEEPLKGTTTSMQPKTNPTELHVTQRLGTSTSTYIVS